MLHAILDFAVRKMRHFQCTVDRFRTVWVKIITRQDGVYTFVGFAMHRDETFDALRGAFMREFHQAINV